ncbi:MAG: RNA polymerase sigma factor [Bacteroidota bacterium]
MEAILVIKAKQGNRKAFEALFRLWQPKIFAHAYQTTQQKEAVEEIAQETWLAIARQLRNLRDEELFPIWVYRITQKKAADWLRAKYREPATERVSEAISAPEKSAQEPSSMIRLLRKEIAGLSADHRLILNLFYLENYDLEEIAIILQLSKGTVKSRLHYAREKLRKRIEANSISHDTKK